MLGDTECPGPRDAMLLASPAALGPAWLSVPGESTTRTGVAQHAAHQPLLQQHAITMLSSPTLA